MKNHTKYLALVSTVLLSVVFAAPAHADSADSPTQRESSSGDLIIAAPAVSLKYERPAVTTAPATETAYGEPVLQDAATEVYPDFTTPPSTTPTQTLSAPTPKAKAPVASASGKGATIASAAYAQLGVPQDCTMLVTNSLAAVGIHFHDWPAGYLTLGTVIPASQAQAGDLAYYANGGTGLAHIAVYVGNGMAVHGGWNGGTTALFSVNVGSGPVFIRVA